MISYTHSIASSGSKLTITNQLMGTTPTFKATFYTTYGGSGTALRLNACTADKLSLPTKVDDWTIHQLGFSGLRRRLRDDRVFEHSGMMIPGVTITMGGRDWLVPPLTLGQLRRLMPRVRQLTRDRRLYE